MCLFYIIRLNKTGILDRIVKKLTEHSEQRNIKIFKIIFLSTLTFFM